MTPNVLDLFCGCGGLSKGFEQAGFNIIAANDIWEDALKTYKLNHPNTTTILGDITNLDIKNEIIKIAPQVDVIVGGPPCQAYSLAGLRDENDPRGHLFKDYLFLVSKLSPKIVVMENVKGILTMKQQGQRVIDQIIQGLANLGYTTQYKTLNAANYGAPQTRERVIFIATRENIPIEFPAPTHTTQTYVSVEQALTKYIGLAEDEKLHHIFSKHRPGFITKIANTAPGKNVIGSYSDAYFRPHRDQPSRTVKENHGSVFIHYSLDRVMTPRELAALQTFEDSFLFEGPKTSVLKQIGNAVPPILAKAIGESVLKMLSNFNDKSGTN